MSVRFTYEGQRWLMNNCWRNDFMISAWLEVKPGLGFTSRLWLVRDSLRSLGES